MVIDGCGGVVVNIDTIPGDIVSTDVEIVDAMLFQCTIFKIMATVEHQIAGVDCAEIQQKKEHPNEWVLFSSFRMAH